MCGPPRKKPPRPLKIMLSQLSAFTHLRMRALALPYVVRNGLVEQDWLLADNGQSTPGGDDFDGKKENKIVVFKNFKYAQLHQNDT